MLSLYTDDERHLDELSAKLRALFAANGLNEIAAHDANALPGGRVHFGYKDGIAQPQIEAPGKDVPDMQPQAKVGDFLLGRDYVNPTAATTSRRSRSQLGDNATYGAFLMLRQDVRRSRLPGSTRQPLAARQGARRREAAGPLARRHAADALA